MKTNAAAIRVNGIGWLTGRNWGGVLGRTHEALPEGDETQIWKRIDAFAYPVRNMGRCDTVTRMTLCACALALKDAGLSYSEGRKTDFGLIGSNALGSLEANRAYFSDYLQAGRTLGRGNLFIYTLPSSPLAEAAIHFGFQGPMLYMGFPGGGVGELLDATACLIDDGSAAGMLAVAADECGAIAFVVGPAAAGRGMERQRVSDLGLRFDCLGDEIGKLASRLEMETSRCGA